MITRNKVTEFYQYLQKEYPNPDRIVLISPNHFNAGSGILESVEGTQKICFHGACVLAISYPGYHQYLSPFPLFIDGNTQEHGIGEHFSFLNTYFSGVSVMPMVLRRKLVP